MTNRAIRQQLRRLLDWSDAHVGFDAAVKGLPLRMRGVVPPGMPHSAWQLVEHLRLAQADILEFCVASNYKPKTWPAGYWPKTPAPPTSKAWARSIATVRRDRGRMQRLTMDPSVDLVAPVPNGDGQTYLREIVLLADHTAYHVGQLVLVRRGLGAWPD